MAPRITAWSPGCPCRATTQALIPYQRAAKMSRPVNASVALVAGEAAPNVRGTQRLAVASHEPRGNTRCRCTSESSARMNGESVKRKHTTYASRQSGRPMDSPRLVFSRRGSTGAGGLACARSEERAKSFSEAGIFSRIILRILLSHAQLCRTVSHLSSYQPCASRAVHPWGNQESITPAKERQHRCRDSRSTRRQRQRPHRS